MARVTITQQNWSAGELSPKIDGRFDLQSFYNGASWLLNFTALTQGVFSYRSGRIHVWHTRDNAAARLITFEYNTEQAYILEFSDQKIRVIKDGGLVTATAQNITGITNANPAVVTYSGADTYANGDRVVIEGVLGMAEVNGNEYTVANVDTGANTFELSGASSLAWGVYTSGGTVAEIIEIASPYLEADLFELEYVQTYDTMYIVHPDYEPRKLTRTSHTAWTLATYTIYGNPFGTTKAASQAITAITKANPAVVTYSGADTYANGDHVFITGVVGMAEVNDKTFTVANVDTGANTFQLAECDSTNFTAYTSGGTIEEWTAFSYPGVIALFERRLVFAASNSYPTKLWLSRGGEYDIFNTGTEADDGIAYQIASRKGNRIRWIASNEDFMIIGTAGSELKASGGGNDDPITPTNITIKPSSFIGSANISPVVLDSHTLFVQRDGRTFRTFEYDAIQDGWNSVNRNLTSDHITRGAFGETDGVKEISYQSGFPNIAWSVKNDGYLLGMTFEPKEQVAGWHKHIPGGNFGGERARYEALAALPRDNAPDQMYYVVKRTINGETVRHIEYESDQPVFPDILEYYTNNKAGDKSAFLQDVWEQQKRSVYLDAALIYDGTVSATLSLSRLSGAGIVATAGSSVFVAADVGREIWGKNGGRGVITGYTSGTVVTIEATVDFPAASIIADDWYLTNDTFAGATHLKNTTVTGLADGSVIEDIAVDENGMFTLDVQASYLVIGLAYTGIYRSMNLEGGGNNGPAQSKPKSVSQVGIKFITTLGVQAGTDPYNLEHINFRRTDDLTSRPTPPFTGTKIVNVSDTWEEEKRVYLIQEQPFPCTIAQVVPYLTTNDG